MSAAVWIVRFVSALAGPEMSSTFSTTKHVAKVPINILKIEWKVGVLGECHVQINLCGVSRDLTAGYCCSCMLRINHAFSSIFVFNRCLEFEGQFNRAKDWLEPDLRRVILDLFIFHR